MKALTGKAKEAFLKHSIGKEIELFEAMLPIYQHALIIEWLDSVGISIQVGTQPNGFNEDDSPIYYYDWEIYSVNNCCESEEEFDTRQQATEKAIERAVELFNGK